MISLCCCNVCKRNEICMIHYHLLHNLLTHPLSMVFIVG